MRSWRYLAPVVAVAVLGMVVLCVVAVPAWLVPDTGLTVPDRLRAENDVRSTMLQALGGLLALGGVALGAFVTVGQVRANREGNTIGLFTKATDQLASEDESVRARGAQTWLGDHSWRRVDLRGADLTGLHIPHLCLAHSNLEGADLRDADLSGATLADVNLRNADLRGANLTDADLAGADLTGARTDDATVWPAGFPPPV